jgi:hypothetical protein
LKPVKKLHQHLELLFWRRIGRGIWRQKGIGVVAAAVGPRTDDQLSTACGPEICFHQVQLLSKAPL